MIQCLINGQSCFIMDWNWLSRVGMRKWGWHRRADGNFEISMFGFRHYRSLQFLTDAICIMSWVAPPHLPWKTQYFSCEIIFLEPIDWGTRRHLECQNKHIFVQDMDAAQKLLLDGASMEDPMLSGLGPSTKAPIAMSIVVSWPMLSCVGVACYRSMSAAATGTSAEALVMRN